MGIRGSLLFALLIQVGILLSQQTVCFTLRDSITGEALEGVLCVVDDSHYYTTDAKGKFCHPFLSDTATVRLAIYQMGRTPQFRRLRQKDTVVLVRAAAQVLDEVVVEARPDIIVKEDTIVYIARHFRDSTEVNIEELLEKLPGFRVDPETGLITVLGYGIKTVMIEGDDIVGQRYQKITRGLSAEMVKKIEVIDEEDNPNVKSINLQLNEAHKLKLLNGKVHGSINTRKKIHGAFTGYFQAIRQKNLISLSYREDGESSFYGFLQERPEKSEIFSTSVLQDQISTWTSYLHFPYLIVPRSNYLNNTEWVLSSDGVYKFWGEKVRLNVEYMQGARRYTHNRIEDYLQPRTIFHTTQTNVDYRGGWNLHLKYEKRILPSLKLYFTNTTTTRMDGGSIGEDGEPNSYYQQALDSSRSNQSDIVLTYKVGDQWTLKFNSSLGYRQQRQGYLTHYSDSLTNIGYPLDTIRQGLYDRVLRWENSVIANYKYSEGSLLSAGLGYLSLRWNDHFNSNFNAKSEKTSRVHTPVSAFGYVRRWRKMTLNLRTNILPYGGKWYYQGSSWYEYRVNNHNFTTSMVVGKIYALNNFYNQPIIFGAYNLLYSFDYRPVERSFLLGNLHYTYTPNNVTTLFWVRVTAKQEYINATRENGIIGRYIRTVRYVDSVASQSSVFVQINGRYFIEKIATAIKLRPEWGISQYAFLIDGENTHSRNVQRGLFTFLRTVYFKNTAIDFSWKYVEGDLYYGDTHVYNWTQHSFKMTCSLKWRSIYVKSTLHYYQYKYLRKSIFLNAYLRYSPRGQSYKLELHGINLFGYTVLQENYVSDFYTTVLSYPLFGRLLGIGFYYYL